VVLASNLQNEALHLDRRNIDGPALIYLNFILGPGAAESTILTAVWPTGASAATGL
jgi:hypothetical protein